MIKLRRCSSGCDASGVGRSPLPGGRSSLSRRWWLALVCTALLVTMPLGAVNRSRSRHPVSVAAQPTFMPGPSARAPRRRKGSTAATPGKRQSSTPSTSTSRTHDKAGTKGHRGRTRTAEPASDPIPMYRTQRERGGSAERAGSQFALRGGHRGRGSEPSLVPWDHGRRSSFRAADEARAVETPAPARSRRTRPAYIEPSATADHPPSYARVAPPSGTLPAGAPAQSYAEGVAHPDDDERLPRRDDGPADSAPTKVAGRTPFGAALPNAGVNPRGFVPPGSVASVHPADPTHFSGPYTQPSVVQGFGGEVALAPPATRPGETRRRNHPTGAYVPEALPPPLVPTTLAERDAITAAAVTPAVLPEIYDHEGRLVMPAPLKGSRDVLVHQNQMGTSDGLERIGNDSDLERLRSQHLLVSFPASEGLHVSDDLPVNRRYARPWTVLFAMDTARAYYERFHQPLQVNSAVRTVNYQARLQRVNGNAAATDGDAASPHLTGQAIDLGKRNMNEAELAWMRAYLLPIMRTGRIDVEEEFHQACFHISVYRSYGAGRRPAREMAQLAPTAVVTAPPPQAPDPETVEESP